MAELQSVMRKQTGNAAPVRRARCVLLTPSVHIHYTPTYAYWLNRVEIWFAKIQRDVIARGIFPSTKDLDKKIMPYIREHNTPPKPPNRYDGNMPIQSVESQAVSLIQ